MAELVYNEHFSTVAPDGFNTGITEYIDNGTRYMNFVGTSAPVRIEITTEMILDSSITKTVTLQEYANGIKQIMVYNVSPSSSTNIGIEAVGYFQDANGNTLPDLTVENPEGVRVSLRGSIPMGFTLTDYGRIPMGEAASKPIYFYPSYVQYGRDPVPGTTANNIYTSGVIFYGDYDERAYEPLTDVKKFNDVLDTWNYSPVAFNFISGNEFPYDTYFDWMHSNGDGTNIIPDPTEKDPSEEGGGGSTDYKPGTKGPHGDDVGIPGLPTVSAVQTGFITMYNPSVANLRSLAGKLWSNDFFENIEKVMNDPFDAIICLNMIPFAPSTSGSTRILIGNYDSAVVAPIVSNQYKNISCGSVSIPENWRNFIDYENTTVDIFLPFVGFKPLNINDVMNDTLAVEYNCDILTGQATCFVTSNGYCLYQYACSIAAQIPLSGSQNSAMVTALSNMATSTISGFIAGGAVGAAGSALISGASAAIAMQSKQVERGGSLNGAIGHLGGFTPYIVIHKPVQSLPSNYRSLKGYPSNIGGTLGSFSGYTEVSYVHLDGVDATDREKEEIDRLLKEGVIL